MNSLIRKCFPQQLKLFHSSIRLCYHYDVDTCEGNFAKKHFNNRPENEPIHLKRARLLYQSRKRGMLENDLLLATFAHKYLNDMNQEELETYDHMINTVSNDWDLYYWAVGIKELPDEFKSPIMDKFIVHVKNEKREKRLRQPDLH